MRFRAPSALWMRGATNTGNSTSRLCSAPRLFQPLRALLPPYPSRPCFMPLALMGFSPSELSPRLQPLRLSTPFAFMSLPPGSNPGPHSKLRFSVPSPVSRLQGVAPQASPFTRCLRLVAHRGRCSPGFRPLQGSPTTSDGTAFTASSPTHFHSDSTAPQDRFPFARCPGASLTRRVACLSPLS
jgi:hypothetical protein